MVYPVSPNIKRAIIERIKISEKNGRCLNVYEVAQELQNAFPQDNVALEDIVAAIVACASTRSLIALEIHNPRPRGGIIIEVLVGEAA